VPANSILAAADDARIAHVDIARRNAVAMNASLEAKRPTLTLIDNTVPLSPASTTLSNEFDFQDAQDLYRQQHHAGRLTLQDLYRQQHYAGRLTLQDLYHQQHHAGRLTLALNAFRSLTPKGDFTRHIYGGLCFKQRIDSSLHWMRSAHSHQRGILCITYTAVYASSSG